MLKSPFLIIRLYIPYRAKVLFCFFNASRLFLKLDYSVRIFRKKDGVANAIIVKKKTSVFANVFSSLQQLPKNHKDLNKLSIKMGEWNLQLPGMAAT